ncbi:MAG: hypothetical protein JAY90_19985 [Candidatus Thiodiazotropha lotti]|nr:hypothetical protein [Candidatus Thiodiazotropha lotti]MCG7985017.1 hypothetical protein [Candidatus Thiodiazotropha lotti]MCW4222809.1 hypothetical protein [Candidatus Thiodiazotropha lotti]
MVEWTDKNGVEIKAGDTIRNNWNDPTELPVLSDRDGYLYLGDMDTPFDVRYQFDTFWEVV